MNDRVYEWKITNTSGGQVLFDDKSLQQQGSVSVYRLTDDILSGWRQGQLLIVPDPSGLIPGMKNITAIDPCQLPLPVRIVGNTVSYSESNVVVDGAPINVPLTTTTSIANSDRRRRVLRVRNTGSQPFWFGGRTVDATNGMILVMPGEIYTERDAPTAEWYAYVAANLSNIGTTILVQQIFAGTV
jgi:hypothetical protein